MRLTTDDWPRAKLTWQGKVLIAAMVVGAASLAMAIPLIKLAVAWHFIWKLW